MINSSVNKSGRFSWDGVVLQTEPKDSPIREQMKNTRLTFKLTGMRTRFQNMGASDKV